MRISAAPCLFAALCLSQGPQGAPTPQGPQGPARVATQDPAATITIEGRVVDMRGEPVSVARIVVSDRTATDGVLARSVADGDGIFRVAKVPKRDWCHVFASSDGRCTGRAYVSGDTRSVRIQVHDAATVRGVLRGRDGKPVASTPVRAMPFGRVLYGCQADAETDADGCFTLTGVPLGPVRCAAVVPGEGLAVSAVIVAGDTEIALTPAPAATPSTSLRIVVKGLPAEVLPQVGASILPYDRGGLVEFPPPWHRPALSADGTCELHPVPLHRYLVSVTAPGYVFAPRQIEKKAEDGPHVFEFAASAAGSVELLCAVRLVGPDGKPLAGVPLVLRAANNSANRAEATTDADGRATFASPLAAGTKGIVYATDDRWVLDQPKEDLGHGGGVLGGWDRRFLHYHECTVDPSATLELRAIAACTVAGRIQLADGRGAPFVDVQLEEESPNRMPRWMSFARTTTDRDGGYRFRGRHPMSEAVRVLVEGPAGAAASEPLALAEPGTSVDVPPLKLVPPAIVEGVVRDQDQKPRPGIRVWLRDWDLERGQQKSGSVVEVVTDKLGRYRFPSVPPGGARLQLLVDGEHPSGEAVAPFAVEPGKTYTFDL